MNAQLLPYRKAKLAKWLFSITLVISLFAFSAPAAVTNRLSQKTSSELFYLNKRRTPAKLVQFGISLLNSDPEVQPREYTLSLLITDRSISIKFNTIAGQYAMARQRILSPAITYIFNHSGQKPS
ncbi:MAG: hypothetical protein JWQ63_4053 [Mucilaginibacter sp.]|nr:hypothetical protein [Mucilaginibacter sp.]